MTAYLSETMSETVEQHLHKLLKRKHKETANLKLYPQQSESKIKSSLYKQNLNNSSKGDHYYKKF